LFRPVQFLDSFFFKKKNLAVNSRNLSTNKKITEPFNLYQYKYSSPLQEIVHACFEIVIKKS